MTSLADAIPSLYKVILKITTVEIMEEKAIKGNILLKILNNEW